MEKTEIKGLIVRDRTGWQEKFLEEVKKQGSGVMWKSCVSDWDNIKEDLRNLISNQGYFEFYHIEKKNSNYYCNYYCKVIDFATRDDYEEKKEKWKNSAWFKESFDGYSDENKSAKIAFLVKDFEHIPDEKQNNPSYFKLFNTQPTITNAVAYTEILTKEKNRTTSNEHRNKRIINQ